MIKRFLSLLLLSAGLAQGAITRVQSVTANTAATNAGTLAIPFVTSTPAPGNIIVVAAHVGAIATTHARMVDQVGITWMEQTRLGSNGCQILAIGKVFSSIASATVTITTNSTQAIAAVAAEYTGTNLRVDRTASANGTGTVSSSGATETTSSANELWVAAITTRSTNSYTWSAITGGFSSVGNTGTSIGTTNNDCSALMVDQIVAATGTPSAGATQSTTNVWIATVVTLEETPAAGATGAVRIPSIGS